jgi:AraC-like DNA-binding protein
MLARSAMLRGFKEQAKALGLDAAALAAEAGVDPAALTNPDLHVPASAMALLYELAAKRSGADDFALRVVARRRMSNLGVIALLAREESTLRQALSSIQRYLWIQNEAIDFSFEDFGSDTLILACLKIPARKQIIDLCIGMLVVVVRHLIGESWRPKKILVPYSSPDRLEIYHKAFRIKPAFEQDLVGVLIASDDLAIRLPTADPDFVTQLRRQLEEATRTRKSGFIAGVRTLIAQRLRDHDCEIDQIAGALGLSRRSLQRQLAEHGLSFTALVDETRRSLVAPLLLDSQKSVQRVSDLLGFSKAGSFNHWFKQRFGCSPSAYRSRRLGDAGMSFAASPHDHATG